MNTERELSPIGYLLFIGVFVVAFGIAIDTLSVQNAGGFLILMAIIFASVTAVADICGKNQSDVK